MKSSIAWPVIEWPPGRTLSRIQAWEHREPLMEPSDAMVKELERNDWVKHSTSSGREICPMTACSWAGSADKSWAKEV